MRRVWVLGRFKYRMAQTCHGSSSCNQQLERVERLDASTRLNRGVLRLLLCCSQEIAGFPHELGHFLAHLRGVAHDMDTSGLKRSNLLGCAALTSSDDGAGMAHAAARWRSLASDEADGRQIAMVVIAKPRSSFFFSLTSDLADHDDTLSLGIVNKLAEYIDKVGAIEGVTSNANNG